MPDRAAVKSTGSKNFAPATALPFVLHCQPRGVYLRSAEDVYRYCMSMADYPKEVFRVLLLNDHKKLIYDELVAIGTLNGCRVFVREVFRSAVALNAAGIIVVHNHPSGDARASAEDYELARLLLDSGRLLGIPVLDNLVIGAGCFEVVNGW